MNEEDLTGLFGQDEHASPTPQAQFINYSRPSGKILSVRVVGHHDLWAHHLWNGARWMSDYIDTHRDEFHQKTILELGAGAGLPSLLAANSGASAVVVTDYPDKQLIENIQINIENICDEDTQKNVQAVGFLWGADSSTLPINKFDIIFMCDIIFNHSEHGKLVQILQNFLKNDGICWCVFSHYRPWYKERDLKFLSMVKEAGFSVDLYETKVFDQIHIPDKRADKESLTTVYAYKILSAPGSSL